MQSAQLVFCRFQQPQRRACILIEKLSFGGQLHLFGAAKQKLGAQLFFQLTHCLADRRLGKKEILCCFGEAFVLYNLAKNAVMFQFSGHAVFPP